MSLAMVDLPSDPDELRTFAQALQAQHAAIIAELRAAKATIQLTALEIEKLKVQLARLRRMQFGQSSERLSREIEQLELRLEELETVEAEAASASVDAGIASPVREKRKPDDSLIRRLYEEGRKVTTGTEEDPNPFLAKLHLILHEKHSHAYRRYMSAVCCLDMVILVVGKVYGQGDLLEKRSLAKDVCDLVPQ